MKIYIAGPMTGIPDFNREKFNIVAEELGRLGDVVLNPAILPDGLYHDEYMKICIAMIDVCDRVVFLPGWENSKGAQIEHKHASYMEIEIRYWEDLQ